MRRGNSAWGKRVAAGVLSASMLMSTVALPAAAESLSDEAPAVSASEPAAEETAPAATEAPAPEATEEPVVEAPVAALDDAAEEDTDVSNSGNVDFTVSNYGYNIVDTTKLTVVLADVGAAIPDNPTLPTINVQSSGKTYSVVGIAASAFVSANQVKTVTIPATYKTIADSAFYGAPSLENVKFAGTPDSIGSDVLAGTSGVIVDFAAYAPSADIAQGAFASAEAVYYDSSKWTDEDVAKLGGTAYAYASKLAFTNNPGKIAAGGSFQLKVGYTPDAAANKCNLEWDSTKPDVMTVADDGTVTVAADAAKGATSVISVTTRGTNGQSITPVKVTLTVGEQTTNVTLDKHSAVIVKSGTVQLNATVDPVGSNTVTYTSDNTSVATVNGSGLVTAKQVEGTAVITASVGDVQDTCTITVVNAITDVTGVTAQGSTTVNMNKGDTTTLGVSVTPINATDKSVTWASNDDSIAAVDAKGVVTAKKTGRTTITATSVTNNSVKATFTVNVKTGVSKVDFEYDPEYTVGKTFSLTADTTPEDLTGAIVAYKWTATGSNGAITVTNATSQTANFTVRGTGDVNIQLEVTCDGVKSTVMHTVKAVATIKSIAFDSATPTNVYTNTDTQLAVTYNPADAKDQGVTWAVDNESIATIGKDTGVLTGKKKGTVKVTATTKVGNISVSKSFTVIDAADGIELGKTSLDLNSVAPITGTKVTVKINPTTANQQFKLTVTGADTTIATVSPTNNGTGTGSFTVTPIANKEGTIIVTITSVDQPTMSAQCVVNIRKMVKSVTGVPVLTNMVKGNEKTWTVVVNPNDASNDDIIWTSSDEKVVTVAPDAYNSKVAVVTAVGGGEATVKATSADNDKAYSEGKVKVVAGVEGITLDKTEMTIDTNMKNEKFTATVTPVTATDKTVVWTCVPSTVATIDASTGVITPLTIGKAIVTATPVDQSGKPTTGALKATATLNVVNPIAVTGVSFKSATHTMDVKTTEKWTADIAPATATNKNVTWTTSNDKIATVDTLGNVTAVAAGKCDITVTTEDGSKSATCTLTVVTPATGITLDKTKADVKTGETVTLKATIAPADVTDKTVTWTSSDDKTATVKDGVVTGVKAGKATVTASTANGKTATCEVTVTSSVATGIKLNKSDVAIELGKSETVTATVDPAAADQAVTWTTSDKAIATVVNGKITGTGKGTATITAATANGKTATCVVTVSIAKSPTNFIYNMYLTIQGRQPENQQIVDQWLAQLKSGEDTGYTVAYKFFFSPEYVAKNKSVADYCTDMYRAILGRDPEAGAIEKWVKRAADEKMDSMDLFLQFIESIEFKQFCADNGIIYK